MADYQVHFQGFHDGASLAAGLAGDIAPLLHGAIAKRGFASLVVSGGSTPVPLFQALSRENIPWQKVLVTLADERWVDPSDHDSNEKLVRQHLLQNRAAAAKFIGLKTEDATARQGEINCEKRLLAIPRPFDVLVLGMGDDGHTASLFPGATELAGATALDCPRLCMAIKPLTASHERMTMTLPALLDSSKIILLISGRAKLQVFEKALAAEPLSLDVLNEMPVRFVMARAKAPVAVCWAP
ncbi:MAG: 6-phosphogluconolactonase [Desulfobulbaceae bacterium]|nr:6-phosphogluconolactonase [Desulfobulbaceae bacterium]